MKQSEGILTLTRGNAVPLGLRLRITAGGEDVPVSACEDVVVRLGNALGERYDVEAEIPTGGADVLRLSLPSSLPAGTYGVEVRGRYGEQDFRVAEERVLRIVEDNEGANIWDGTSAELPEMELSLWAAPLPGGQDKKAARPTERLVVVGKSIPFWVGHNDPYREIYYAFPVRDRYKGDGYSVHGACVSFRFRLAELRKFAEGEITLPSAPNNLFSVTAHFRQDPKGYSVTHVKADSIEGLLDEVDGMGKKFRSAMNNCLEAFAESKANVNVMTLTYEIEAPDLNGWAIAVYQRDEYGYVVSVENIGLNDSYLRSASPNILWAGHRPTLLARPHVEEAQGAPFSFQGASTPEKKDFYSSGQDFFKQHLNYKLLCHRGYFHGLGVRIYKEGEIRFLFKGDEMRNSAWCRFNKTGIHANPKFKAGRYLLRCFYRNVEADEGTEVLLMMRYVRCGKDEEGELKSYVRHAVKVSNLTYHHYY